MDFNKIKNTIRLLKLAGRDGIDPKSIKDISESELSLTQEIVDNIPYELKIFIENKVHVMDFENNKLVLKPVKIETEDKSPPSLNKIKDYDKDGGDAKKVNKKMIDNDLNESDAENAVEYSKGGFSDEDKEEYLGLNNVKDVEVKVPRSIISDINNTIKDIQSSIADYDEKGYNDGAGANSNKNKAIEALEQIKTNLKSRDYEGFKEAQQFFLTLMSPITDLFPPTIVNFLANGEDVSVVGSNTYSEVKPHETKLKEHNIDPASSSEEDKVIKTTYQIASPESVEQGDYEDTGWEDEEGESMVPDQYDREEGITAVDKAVEFLRHRGAAHASQEPYTGGGNLWFSDDGDTDFRTGNTKTLSYHLSGFSEEEMQEIYNRVRGKGRGLRESTNSLQQYTSLNNVYENGNTEIWYMKAENFRDGTMGYKFLRKINKLPDPNNLDRTHILLGKISETNPDSIMHMMQGEMWSPNGEARSLIRAKGLRHTSMTVGDIIVIAGKALMVDDYGFKELHPSNDTIGESFMFINKDRFDGFFMKEILPEIISETDKESITETYNDIVKSYVNTFKLPKKALYWSVPENVFEGKELNKRERKSLQEYLQESKKKRKKTFKDPCQKGYEMYGTKKNEKGQQVPNCGEKR